MKLFRCSNPKINVRVSKLRTGAILVCLFSFNSLYAAEYSGLLNSPFIKKVKCEFKCKPDGNGGTICEFLPVGCNSSNNLNLPNSKIDKLTNPKLTNPKLINPKRNLLPGDQFQSKPVK